MKVYGADKGIFANNTYEAVANRFLTLAAQSKIGSAELSAAVGGQVTVDTQTFRNGQASGGLGTPFYARAASASI